MVKIHILQTDNRPPLNTYLELSINVNATMTKYLQESNQPSDEIYEYSYAFYPMPKEMYESMHPATAKILFIHTYLQIASHDILIFLDTDAWIQNPIFLDQLLKTLSKTPEKQGCFSRDPYLEKNTYINSGSFILKVNDYTKAMYKSLVEELTNPLTNTHLHIFPFDQYYISKFVYMHRNDFMIFRPKILNTPQGIILRHNWFKNQTMVHELQDHIVCPFHTKESSESYMFNFEQYYDKEDFPNTSKEGYEYFA